MKKKLLYAIFKNPSFLNKFWFIHRRTKPQKIKKTIFSSISFKTLFFLTLLLCLFTTFYPFLSATGTPFKQKPTQLKIAIKDNIRPLGFRDNTGTLQGLEIDIAHKLAEEIYGNPDAVELIPVSNKDRLNVILEEKVNFTIARVTATETRGRLVEFSIPYYLDGTGIITKNPNIKNLQNITNQTIAVLNNSDTIANIKYFIPKAKLLGTDSYQNAKTLIEQGQATAFAGDASILAGWVQENPDYHILPTLLTAEPLSIVMPKGLQYANLRLEVNYAIQAWKAEGWLENRLQYWGLPLTQDTLSTPQNFNLPSPATQNP
ncbi:MAG TPA: transporter substrate-binding domain-containing protein [Halomicronema sp.]